MKINSNSGYFNVNYDVLLLLKQKSPLLLKGLLSRLLSKTYCQAQKACEAVHAECLKKQVLGTSQCFKLRLKYPSCLKTEVERKGMLFVKKHDSKNLHYQNICQRSETQSLEAVKRAGTGKDLWVIETLGKIWKSKCWKFLWKMRKNL